MKQSIIICLMLSWTTIVFSQTLSLDVANHGFRANWFESNDQKAPTLILFGGSEGGTGFGDLWAPKLNDMGYHVLSMAYFGEEGLPEQLELIPLEYLDKAIGWLDDQQGGTAKKFGLIGVSKGAELALIQAGRLERFHAVVALAPSSVIWQSINRKDFMSNQSSWTLSGEPLKFLPYCFAKGYQNIFNFYDCALDDLDQNAVIDVENIQAPILLLSGRDDKLWPSERMANMIVETLTVADHQYPFLHKNYPAAGHWLVAPHLDPESKGVSEQEMSAFDFLGGSAEELVEISQLVEEEVYKFLREHLNR